MTIIGLGEAGCNIAEMFEGKESEDIKVKLVDHDIEGENCFSILKQTHPEHYEQNFPDASKFLEDCDNDVLLFLAGGGDISGVALKLLNYIKNKNIHIFYIRPDTELLGSVAKMQNNLVFNVLQEYTRSGLFKSMMLIDNQSMEEIIGNTPVSEYFKKINEVIFNTLYTLIKAPETISAFDNYSPPKETSCIRTYGIYDIENDIEKMFFNLNNITDKCYYFFINKKQLETDGTIFKKIKKCLKNKAVDNLKISFIMFPTDLEQNYCYTTAASSRIQH